MRVLYEMTAKPKNDSQSLRPLLGRPFKGLEENGGGAIGDRVIGLLAIPEELLEGEAAAIEMAADGCNETCDIKFAAVAWLNPEKTCGDA